MHAYRSQPPPSTVSVTTFPRPASGSASTSRSTLRRALDSSRVWERSTDKDWYSRAIVEAVGTFALIFVGAGSIVATGGQNLVAIALAHGLAIGLMVAAAGQISGGLYNPALTVGLISARRMPLSRGIYYIVSQLIGATFAALALKTLFTPAAIDAVQLGTPALGAGVNAGSGMLAEFIMTFFLMYSVFGVAVDVRGARAIAGLVIGLTITMDVFVGGGLTGAAMNPARWFGPAVVQGVFADWWVYWVGPIIGAVLAAVLWNDVYLTSILRSRPYHRTQAGAGRLRPARSRGRGLPVSA
jgi:MIP family channel proteins